MRMDLWIGPVAVKGVNPMPSADNVVEPADEGTANAGSPLLLGLGAKASQGDRHAGRQNQPSRQSPCRTAPITPGSEASHSNWASALHGARRQKHAKSGSCCGLRLHWRPSGCGPFPTLTHAGPEGAEELCASSTSERRGRASDRCCHQPATASQRRRRDDVSSGNYPQAT
jgi:hypothetical protein